MRSTLRPLMIFAAACALSACASRPLQPEVGAVVVAPQVRPAPVPTLVQQVEPMPVNYFQLRLMERRKKKMTPTGRTF